MITKGFNKMKKLILSVISLILSISLVACSGGTAAVSSSSLQSSDSQSEQSPDSSSISSVEVDENLITVDITLPASFFENKTEEEIKKDDDGNYKKITINDDGSVTFTMTKAKHAQLLKNMQEEFLINFSEMVESEDFPYITAIDCSKDFSKVTISVDGVKYKDIFFDVSPLAVGLSIMMYQSFAGESNATCTIDTVDNQTNEIIDSVVYPDVLKK